MTTNLLKSSRLFSVFGPISIMLGWSPLVLLFPSPPVLVLILLLTVSRAPITIAIFVTFMFRSFFNSLARSRYLSFFHCDPPGQQSRQFLKFSFFVGYYKIWSSGRDLVIRLYLKILEEFERLILLDRCWVVHIPFVRIVKLQTLAQFPVDHLSHPELYSFCANFLHSLII